MLVTYLRIELMLFLPNVIIILILSIFQLTAYKEAQEAAKKNHANIWEYGDITEDDAKEFGLGK